MITSKIKKKKSDKLVAATNTSICTCLNANACRKIKNEITDIMAKRMRIKSHCRLLNVPFDIGAMVVKYFIPRFFYSKSLKKVTTGNKILPPILLHKLLRHLAPFFRIHQYIHTWL